MTLGEIREGNSVRIVRVRGSGPFRRRLMEMGFVPGETVTVRRYAPLMDPIEFIVKDYHVSLRRADAVLVEVVCIPCGNEPSGSAERPRGRGWRNRWRRG